MTRIDSIDLFVLCLYFIAIIVLGIWAGRSGRTSSEGYFLGGRSLSWPVIGASLFASNISTVHLVGLAESGYLYGLVWGNFEWFAVFELLILALVFVPFFLKSRITTLPEFLEKRYDSRSRMVLAVFSILAALFMHIGVSLYAGAVVFEKMFGVDIILSILVIGAATGVYAVFGGFLSVVVTESLQTILLIAGAVVLTILGIWHLPDVGILSYADLKFKVGPDRMQTIGFDSAEYGFSFFDMFFGHLVLGIWYWCTDQTIVQRTLGAQSAEQGQLGAVFAGFLKVLPVFVIVFPGILAYALFRDQIGSDSQGVLPYMIMNLMPVGLKGLMLASLLAAVMSSVAAALNSASTLMVYDILTKARPQLSERSRILAGRITALVVLVLAVSWSPFLRNLGTIFELINQLFSIFAPSIVAVFLWGIISRAGTASASLSTLIGGSLFALAVFIVEKYVVIEGIRNYISSTEGLGIHWLRQTYLFFIVSSAIYFSVSILDRKATTNIGFEIKWSLPTVRVLSWSVALLITIGGVYAFFY